MAEHREEQRDFRSLIGGERAQELFRLSVKAAQDPNDPVSFAPIILSFLSYRPSPHMYHMYPCTMHNT